VNPAYANEAGSYCAKHMLGLVSLDLRGTIVTGALALQY
jgi:hypothetical protein